jgi:hypothetical protein
MSTHYICLGDCGGETAKAGVCKAPGCTDEGRPLKKCECEDGAHMMDDEVSEDEDEEFDDVDMGE